MSVYLPRPGQLVRVVTGEVNLVVVVDAIDRGAVVLDVPGTALPAGIARLSFNSSFGGVLLPGHLAVDGRGTRFWPGTAGARFDQRRETFRVTVALPALLEPLQGPPLKCETLNLSIGGVLLETDRPFAPGNRLTVTIQCTESHSVAVTASVVRSDHGVGRLAVAFTDVGGRDERTLSLLVAAAQRCALAAR
ncbi:MAG TPA: PilZ domain-containing protein [Solirubrobacteraceae bacterium]